MPLSPLTTTFTPQPNGGVYGINAYGPDYIEVNGERHTTPLILCPTGGPLPRPGLDCAGLAISDMEKLLEFEPELVLIGTGNRQRFLHPSLLSPLSARRIGVECMSLAAACRTFNLLAAEGRKTVAVLMFQ